MLCKTNGIVLRSVKYGDSSLVSTIFTAGNGVQAYMIRGVRSAKSKQNRAAFFQPGMLLEMVVYHQPLKNIQQLQEYQLAYMYQSVMENVVKNSIVLFSVELLLRLIPENSPLPELFGFAYDYFIAVDKTPQSGIANFPLYFITKCSSICGYELKGGYSNKTPHLNLQEGGFTEQSPAAVPFTKDEDAAALELILKTRDYDALQKIEMNAGMRLRLIDWFISFLQCHSQHMGNIRSLTVLQTILH
jgi:DNA repair protein RecO (recombination protein O)